MLLSLIHYSVVTSKLLFNTIPVSAGIYTNFLNHYKSVIILNNRLFLGWI